MATYEQYIKESIVNNLDLGIREVEDIRIVKTLPFYHKYFTEIESILKTGNYKELDKIEDGSKSFDDITVITFKSENNLEYYGIIYDDWALWTDPILTAAYPFNPNGS